MHQKTHVSTNQENEVFPHTGLDPETSYYYQISAVNLNGEESDLSDVQSTDTLPPGNIIIIEDEDGCSLLEDAEWTDDPVETCTLLEDYDLLSGDDLTIEEGILFVIDDGITLTSSALITNYGTIDNFGTITSLNTINEEGTINNFDTFNSIQTFDNTSGILSNEGTFVSGAFFHNTDGGEVTNDGDFTNNGDFENDGGELTNTSTLTNNKLMLLGGIIENNLGVFDNKSDIDLTGDLTNTATINNPIGSSITISPSGSIVNTSGSINNLGSITNQCAEITGTIDDNPPIDECFPTVTIDLPTILSYTNNEQIDFSAFATDIDNYGIDVGNYFRF